MEKAVIAEYNLKNRQWNQETLTVQFNPDSYSISRANTFQMDMGSSPIALRIQFLKREVLHLSVELLFDTFQYGVADAALKNVRGSYALLRNYTKMESEQHAPPVILFSWGQISFVGEITSMKETYTMFSESGIPVRAKVVLELQGCNIEDLIPNPNNSPDRTRFRTVCQGDSLWKLSQESYGSPEHWRAIAKANNIENPRRLTASTVLTIPALPGGKE